MRKLKLDVEKLEITSFGTEEQELARGTVDGRGNQTAASAPWTCAFFETCPAGCESGVNTCGSTCGSVCADSMGFCATPGTGTGTAN